MLREPRRPDKPIEVRKDVQPSRFRMKKLEERIAPGGGNSKFHTDNGNHYGQNK